MRMEFDYINFTKWVGVILIIIGIILFMEVIIMEIIGFSSYGIIQYSIQLLVYGVVIVGIGKIIQKLNKIP